MTDARYDLDDALRAADAAFRNLASLIGHSVPRSARQADVAQAVDALDGAIRAAKDARTAEITGAVAGRVKSPLKAPFTPLDQTGDHRREHRPGRPRRLDTDAELRAFVEARIDHLTFEEIAAEVVDHFPKDRRIGRSAIHAWWKRSRR